MPFVNVECVQVGEIQTNCYLVENTETHELLIVDPGAQGETIQKQVGSRRPVAVLLTHGHFDHIAAADVVCEHYGIPLYIHEADAEKLLNPEKNVSLLFGGHVAVHTLPIKLHGGEQLLLGGLCLTVLHTPGHSKGGCCFLLPDGQGVLCGDTLFAAGYGRTDFADGNFTELKQSLKMLFALTPKQPAYPGHGEQGMTGRNAQGDAL
ncbi:MAG: MBL fold metallo-hydrolase [Clostridia bacterium]